MIKIRILLFLYLATALLITDDVNAKFSSRGFSLRGFSSRGFSSRGSSSRGSSSRGSSSRGSWSGSSSSSSRYGSSSGGRMTGSSPFGAGSSSGGHTTGLSPSRYGSSSDGRTTGSSPFGTGSPLGGHTTGISPGGYGSSSGGRMTGSNPFGAGSPSGGHTTRLSPGGHGSSSGGHTTGSNPVGRGTSSGQTSHQQNKDSSTSFLNAEGGGATRPSQTNSARPDQQPSAPHGIYPGSQTGKPGFATDNKQNSAPYNPPPPYNPSVPYKPSAPYNPHNPSAPSIDLSKSTVVPSQNHAPTSFGQPSAPYSPHGTAPHNNPSWSNPHFNPSQPSPPNPPSTNIGFKDHLRPTSMPLPSHPTFAPYPRPPPYPISGSNPYPPPYSAHTPHSFGHPNQPHSTFNPSHSVPSQTIGHPYSYPAHIPPPVPNTFGNPYSTHPVGGTYGSAGHSYYPQQHVLAQPAAQPYIPGQTVIMVPGQQDSGRGFGQMVKEALVFSTINAGVNRLINPHHHYSSSSQDYNRPPSSSTTSETHITYNNHYFNGAPSGNTPMIPASPNVPQGNVPVTYPANYPSSVNNPVITPGVSIPTIVGNNGNVTYPADGSSMNTAGTNNMGSPPVVPPSGFSAGNTVNNQSASNQGTTVYSPQYRITDNELWILTEELFAKQEVNISKYLTIHLQSKSENVTDAAKGPLIYAQQEVYDYPTIYAIRELYDIYEHNSTVKEKRTPEKQKKENLLLDMFLNTNVMAKAMQWLSDRGFIDPDDFERKDILRRIWFSQFDGATSGFERVFTSERYGTDLLGVQDWIYFDYQESKKRIDYMGYTDTLKLGDGAATLLKLNFKMDDIIRPNATIFVGTLPELEMSLYTICFYARPNNLCPVSLGGAKFNIFTHSFRYYGKDVIDLALPIF